MAVEIKTESGTQDPEHAFWQKWKKAHLNDSIPSLSTVGPEAESFLFQFWKLRRRYQNREIELAELSTAGKKLYEDVGELDKKVEKAMSMITRRTQRQSLP